MAVEKRVEVVNAKSAQIKDDRGKGLNGDFGGGLQGFQVVVDTHGEDEQHGDYDSEIIPERECDVKQGRDGNVGNRSEQKSKAKRDTAEPRNGLGVGVAAVDRSSLQATSDRGVPDPVGQERRGCHSG